MAEERWISVLVSPLPGWPQFMASSVTGQLLQGQGAQEMHTSLQQVISKLFVLPAAS